jgi:hypothetical protein
MGKLFSKASQGGYLEVYWNRRKALPVNSIQETEACAHSLKGSPGTLSEELTHVRLEGISATSGSNLPEIDNRGRV